MSAEAAIAAALRAGAQLWCEGTALRFSAPRGADLSWREELARHRDAVRALIGNDRLAPASAAQEELWTADQLGRGTTYAMPLAFLVDGKLDRARLASAVGALLERHAALRTTFELIGDVPVQRIAPHAAVAIGGREPRVAPHDLRRGPLLHVTAADRGAQTLLWLNLHHIAGDWQTLGTLVTELAALYEGRELAPAPAQTYAAFAASERAASTDDARRYWQDALRDAPPLLSLARDFPPGDAPDPRGARIVRAFRDPLAPAARTTPFINHLALFAALLARHARQEEVVIGCPFSTRRDEDEGVAGLFVNMLPIRVRVPRPARLRDLVEQVRESVLAAHEHRRLPFAAIAAGSQRTGARPLLQATFDHQEPLRIPSAIGGMAMERVLVPIETAKFDLSVTVTRRDVTWEYAAAAFRASSIETLAAEHLRLVETFAADPEATVDAVAGVPPNALVRPEAPRFLDVLARHAAERPESVAVESEEEAIPYPELLRRAECIAHALAARGIGAEERVGVLIERSADLVVAACGLLLSGAAYLPLETGAPEGALAETLAAANARLVLTGPGSGAIPEGVEALALRDAVAHGARKPLAAPQADSLAYVIRTSGTTGTPKCVGVSHRSLDTFLASITKTYEWTPADRVLLFTNPAFDASIEEVVGALYAGSTLVAHGPALLAPSDIVAVAAARGVTGLDLTTAYFHNFADWLTSAGIPLPESLRMVTVGGGKMSAAAAESWLRAAPRVRLFNAYGPTETTVSSLVAEIASADGGEVPIGVPVDGATAVIVDGELRPVPPLVPGELLIGGVAVARGYLNAPARTAERFVPDPFGEPGARRYRTGDLARRRADGTFEYLGRIDRQVKVRGYRVEPEEVESVLAALEGVQAAVVLTAGEGDALRLEAWVARRAGAPLARETVEAALAARLPVWARPSRLTVVDALPLTPRGKVDLAALRALSFGNEQADTAPAQRIFFSRFTRPMWEEVLQVEGAKWNDRFYESGGHSLAMLQLIARVRKTFDVEIPLSFFYRSPSLHELGEEIRARLQSPIMDFGKALHARADAAARIIPLQPEGEHPPLFLVHAVGGHLTDFVLLARQLKDRGQPVYGVQAAGLAEGEEPFEDIAAMARHYAPAVLEAAAGRPIRLGGYCFGGVVALELARQLERVGADVELTVAVETQLGGAKPAARDFDGEALFFFACELKIIMTLDDLLPVPASERASYLWEQFSTQLPRDAALMGEDVFRRLCRLYVAHDRANRSFVPAPWHGPVLVLDAEEGTPAERFAAWRACVPNALRQVVPGNHVTMLREPHVRELASRLDRLLNLSARSVSTR